MVTKTTYKYRENWLVARNEQPVIGSSDVGTIMGINPYLTPYQYWMRHKNGYIEESGNENLYRGQYKEDAIAKMFERVSGEKIIKRSSGFDVYHNNKYPKYVQVAPDREVFAKGRGTRLVVECKDTKMYIPQLDIENTPKTWYVQIQYQMGVMEREGAYIVAENGDKNIIYALFSFDENIFEHIMTYCCDWFERYILGDDIPPIETSEDAVLAWPGSIPERKQVTSDIAYKIENLKEKKGERRIIDKEIDELESDIKIIFEDKEALEYEGNILATYKTKISTRIDTKLLREECPGIAEKYTIKTTNRCLLIK